MAKKRPSVGDMVHITFFDHAENSPDAIYFEVIGRLFEITKKAYKVRSWGYVSDVDRARDSNDYNESWYVIVKSAIESIRIIK